MKLPASLFSIFLLLFAPAPFLFADDHDEEEDEDRILIREDVPAQDEILKFYQAHIPSAMPILDRVRTHEGEDAYNDVLREAAHQIAEYRDIREHDGDEMAELFIEGVRLDMEIAALVFKYHEIDDSRRERQATEEQLRGVIGEQYEHSLRSHERELEWLSNEVKNTERLIDEMKSHRDAFIDEELEGALHGDHEDEDEDHDEDDYAEEDEDEEEEEEDRER
ncbi:MAG: hypothetical protein AAGA58_11570 [Verrucomicrobiota bacterium]